MPISVKTDEELNLMRQAGYMLAQVHEKLHEVLRPGMSTLEIDAIGEEEIRKLGGIPNCKGYEGYPASVCISVNDEIVHGIPKADKILKEGDIVSFDTGLTYKGFNSDAARTWGVGNISPEAKKLIDITEKSFFEGIKFAKSGNHLYDISRAIDKFVRPYGYGIVRELTGHGIGRHLHEEPMIPNYRKFSRGVLLKPGMTLCVEPMITMGNRKIAILDDDWTVVTIDGSISAHYENTIAITPNGEPEILTIIK